MGNKDSLSTSNARDNSPLEEIVENSRILAETASDAIITIDENSIIRLVNKAAVDIFGYSLEEMIGSELTMLMPDYLRHLHREGLRSYVETGTKHVSWEAVELPGLHKSGNQISLELSFGEFQSHGQRFFTGIARDITRRKRDEHRIALQHSVSEILSQSSTIADAAPKLLGSICKHLDWQFAGFWAVSGDTEQLQLISYWREHSSKNAAEFELVSRDPSFDANVGFPGVVLAGKKPLWVPDFGQEDFPRSPVAARENLHSAFGFPIRLGEDVLGVIELFSEASKEPDSRILETLLALGNQIGQFIERKNQEQQLIAALSREREARLEAETLHRRLSAVERITSAALGHLTVDLVMSESLNRIREVINVDTVAILLFETEGNELVAWAAHGLEEEVELGVRIPVGKGFAGRVFADRKPVIIADIDKADVLNPLLREKGIKSLLGVPLFVEGRPTGVLHVGKMQYTSFSEEDVKLLELAADRIALAIENARLYQVEQIARAAAEAANKAKDEFLTILSHELRTPLTPIIGWVHMMENGILKEAEFHRVLSIIDKNAASLKRLINDLLDMSAILSGKMRIEEVPVQVDGLLEECVETMRTFAGESKVQLHLDVKAAPDDLVVIGDRSRLHQSFCNIIHNAIKFSAQNTAVNVKCETTNDDVVICVQDQGAGIPVEFLPFIFERFRQADGSRTRTYGGLGLGLSLVKSFIDGHHGVVEATSEGEGKGATFVIRLPRARQSSSETALVENSLGHGTTTTPTRVLVVEDQVDTLEMLMLSLRQRGFEVAAVDSAHKAIEFLEKEQVDVLVSDIAMPAMDGLELIKALRQSDTHRKLPAIALTGYASKHDVSTTLGAGFDLHLPKPIDPSDLVREIEELLKKRKNNK